MNRLSLERLDVQPDDAVLEIGFGGGDLLRALLAGRPGRVFGVDVSQAMVERARQRFRGAGERLRLFEASAERLPLADAAVDKAVSVNSLYFWPDPAAAMAELARVIRRGGRLVLCFEPPEELRKWPGHRFGFQLHSARDLVVLAGAAGFGDPQMVQGVGRKPDRFLCLSLERLGAID